RSRLPGDVLRAAPGPAALVQRTGAVPRRPVAAAMGPVPPHVRVGLGEAGRRDLAQFHRPGLPLRDPAPARALGVVPAPGPAVVPRGGRSAGVLLRTYRAPADLRPPASAPLRFLRPRRLSNSDPGHGQFR